MINDINYQYVSCCAAAKFACSFSKQGSRLGAFLGAKKNNALGDVAFRFVKGGCATPTPARHWNLTRNDAHASLEGRRPNSSRFSVTGFYVSGST